MEAVRELGFDALMRERVATRACRCSASAWACSSCSSRARARRRGGARPARGRVVALDAPGLKVPHIGWNECWTNGDAARGRALRPGAFYHVHSFAPRPATRRGARHVHLRRPSSRASVARTTCSACSSTPRSPARTGWRCCANFVASRRVILLPAIDIRGGKAVRLRAGRLRPGDRLHDDPLEAARAWVEAGARFLHVVDLDGARGRAAQNLAPSRAHRPRAAVPGAVRRRPARRRADRRALAAGADRVILGTAAYTDVEFLDAGVPARIPARARRDRRARRATCRSPAGRRRPRCGPRT